jgi:membrane protease YdiL (CAAX protease family)
MCYVVHSGKIHSLREIGFVRFGLRDGLAAFIATVGVVAIYFLFTFLLSFLPESAKAYVSSGYNWKLSSLRTAPLVFILCMVTGYREEFLFRSYFLAALSGIKSPVPLSVAISTLLFGLLHSYEGIAAMIFAAIAGFYFSLVFLKTKNLHVIAIAHGLFNAFVIGFGYLG